MIDIDWLFPFQKEDLQKLLTQPHVLVAGEMGTGKTYEAIALDLVRREKHNEVLNSTKYRTLVVAPLTILESVWLKHYQMLAPHLKIIVMDNKNRGDFIRRFKDYDVCVVHWEGMRLTKELQEVSWNHIIADEAHRAKNRKAQQTRGLKKLRAEHRSALTGTPVMNKPQDLWSILHWLYPSAWKSYWRFYETFVDYDVVKSPKGPPIGYHKIKGPKNVELLKEVLEPIMVRRLKKDVLQDLPDKYYTVLEVELYPAQRKAYDQMKKEMLAWLETQDGLKPLAAPVVIAQLVRLQQLALAYADIRYETNQDGGSGSSVRLTEPSSKVDALMQLLEDNPDEPIVVFSQFKQAIRLVEDRLGRAGIRYARITGDDSQRDRQLGIDLFQGGGCNVFLGTIGAGSEGITLTRSSTVVFLDRDWTPARNAQAEDRLHRIGQRSAVQVIDIVAKRTVDQYRMKTLEMKKEWIRKMIDS